MVDTGGFIITVSASVVATVVAAIFMSLSQRLGARLNALLLPPQVKFDETRNSILLVGIGGVGKTSLIKALTRNPAAEPRVQTKDFEIYNYVEQIEDVSSGINKTNLFIADYRGQDIAHLIGGFLREQKEPYSPLTVRPERY